MDQLELTQDSTLITAQLTKEGLTGSKAKMIEAAFAPMVEMLKAFEIEYDAVMAKEVTKETCAEARALRLKMVKIRTGAANIHKEQKAEFLRGGRAIDAVKNVLEFAVVEKENKLEEREKHFENIERTRREEIKAGREAQLSPYITDTSFYNLIDMPDNVFENLLSSSKLALEAKQAAEAQAEKKRIEDERVDALHRVRKNEALMIWQFFPVEWRDECFGEISDEKWAELMAITNTAKADEEAKQAKIKAENDRLKAEAEAREKQVAAEKAQAEESARKEREAIELENRKKLAVIEEQAKKDREEKEKIAAELGRKNAEIIRAQAEADAKAEAELAKGDKAKFDDLIKELEALKVKYTFKSKKHRDLQITVNDLLNKTINYAISKL